MVCPKAGGGTVVGFPFAVHYSSGLFSYFMDRLVQGVSLIATRWRRRSATHEAARRRSVIEYSGVFDYPR